MSEDEILRRLRLWRETIDYALNKGNTAFQHQLLRTLRTQIEETVDSIISYSDGE